MAVILFDAHLTARVELLVSAEVPGALGEGRSLRFWMIVENLVEDGKELLFGSLLRVLIVGSNCAGLDCCTVGYGAAGKDGKEGEREKVEQLHCSSIGNSVIDKSGGRKGR